MLIGKLKYNGEKYSINPKEIRKRIQRKTTDRTKENKKQNVELNAIKLIITLNIKGLSNPNKRQRLSEWIK